jgi:hypothetical protein
MRTVLTSARIVALLQMLHEDEMPTSPMISALSNINAS